MTNNSIDSLVLLKNFYEEGNFSEKQLNMISGGFMLFGVILNMGTLVTSINNLNKGITSFIVSIAFLDILNLMLLLPELNFINSQNWKFSQKLCFIYMGTECLISILIFYTTIALNLTVISNVKLIQSKIKVHNIDKEEYHLYDSSNESDELDDIEQGYEILESCREEPISRYEDKNESFSFLFLLILILAVSVSIPFFLYAQKQHVPGTNNSICVMKPLNDPIFNNIIEICIIFVRVLIPSMILLTTTIVLLLKNFKAKPESTRIPIKIALTLSMIFIVCSFQRFYGTLITEFVKRKLTEPFQVLKYSHAINSLSAIMLTLLHYLSSLIRPFSLLMIQVCSRLSCITKTRHKSTIKTKTAIKTINNTIEL
uniref:CSON011195 protein n=1 Tax=Culicoides sonorensis TaxID=179676 RepID=A0A336LLM6_CULSO